MALHVQSLAVGPLQANCHIVSNPETKEAIIIDPGGDSVVIEETFMRRGLTVKAIWLTHAHIDHIGALREISQLTSAPISIHPAEKEWLTNPSLNLASFIGIPFDPQPAHDFWNDGDGRAMLGRDWKIMHVPGHSPGLCAILCESEHLAFVGDLIMAGSIGRTDLPFGNHTHMAKSVARFMELSGDWKILSGHGDETTLDRERSTNPLVRECMELASDMK